MHIIHLDDQNLFRKGVENFLSKEFSNLHIEAFSDNTTALEYVQKCLVCENKIDCIITDYNHQGDNGLEFAKAVRTIEKEYNCHMPIIMLTMRHDELLKQAAIDGLLDAYFTKDITCEEITTFINKYSCNKSCDLFDLHII